MLVIFFLPLQFDHSRVRKNLQGVDWIGIGIFIGSIMSILIAITRGGVTVAWSSWNTIVPICIGVSGLAAFTVNEAFFAKEPFIPKSILANRSTILAYITSCLYGVVSFTLVYYLPLYFEGAKQYSIVISGVSMLSFTAGIAPAAAATGVAITKANHYRWSLWLGWSLSVLGMGLMLLLQVKTSIAVWVIIILFNAIANGIVSSQLPGFFDSSAHSDTTYR